MRFLKVHVPITRKTDGAKKVALVEIGLLAKIGQQAMIKKMETHGTSVAFVVAVGKVTYHHTLYKRYLIRALKHGRMQ